MVLSEKEEKIVNNMRSPYYYIHCKEEDVESYENLSDEELDSLIGKLDDYKREVGEEQRAFGNYDEFYILEFQSIKSTLEKERKKRKSSKTQS